MKTHLTEPTNSRFVDSTFFDFDFFFVITFGTSEEGFRHFWNKSCCTDHHSSYCDQLIDIIWIETSQAIFSVYIVWSNLG